MRKSRDRGCFPCEDGTIALDIAANCYFLKKLVGTFVLGSKFFGLRASPTELISVTTLTKDLSTNLCTCFSVVLSLSIAKNFRQPGRAVDRSHLIYNYTIPVTPNLGADYAPSLVEKY